MDPEIIRHYRIHERMVSIPSSRSHRPIAARFLIEESVFSTPLSCAFAGFLHWICSASSTFTYGVPQAYVAVRFSSILHRCSSQFALCLIVFVCPLSIVKNVVSDVRSLCSFMYFVDAISMVFTCDTKGRNLL